MEVNIQFVYHEVMRYPWNLFGNLGEDIPILPEKVYHLTPKGMGEVDANADRLIRP